MIFETERLVARKLKMEDVNPFFEMQSNPKVLQYATGEVASFSEVKKRLQLLIDKYDEPNNDFWIYAVERKADKAFVGTVALVKDGVDDEIGYRFLEKYWNNGFGREICQGLIPYAKGLGMPKLIGYVIDENVASAKILEHCGFTITEKMTCKETGLPETKYELVL